MLAGLSNRTGYYSWKRVGKGGRRWGHHGGHSIWGLRIMIGALIFALSKMGYFRGEYPSDCYGKNRLQKRPRRGRRILQEFHQEITVVGTTAFGWSEDAAFGFQKYLEIRAQMKLMKWMWGMREKKSQGLLQTYFSERRTNLVEKKHGFGVGVTTFWVPVEMLNKQLNIEFWVHEREAGWSYKMWSSLG